MWQDVVLSACNFVLIIALLPSVFSEHKPALTTSLVTGSALSIMGITFATLSLWLTMIALFISSVLWFVLALQSFSNKRGKTG
jgi:hypothetical protein